MAHSGGDKLTAMNVERIIECIREGDHKGVKAELQQFNREYAQCFFYDLEEKERRKRQELEEFRKNKVREYVSDSDSDYDDESGNPDALLRQALATILIRFLQTQPQGRVLKVCLRSLRILSRDKKILGPLITDRALLTLAKLGGISNAPIPGEDLDNDVDPYSDVIIAISEDKSSHPDYDDDDSGGDEDGSGAVTSELPSDANYASNWRSERKASTFSNMSLGAPRRRSSVFKALTPGKRDSRGSVGGEEEEEEKKGGKDDEEVNRKEVMKIFCNIVYNSAWAQERASELSLLCGLTEKLNKEFETASSPCGQFYELRFMFLLTALRPELRAQLKQEGGVSLLTTVLEQCLSVQWKEQYEVVLDPTAPPTSVEDSQKAQEALKILFNITHSTHTQKPEEGDASLYRHLAAVLRHCLMVCCEEEEASDELKGHAANMLSALPLSCLDVLVSVSVGPNSQQMNGVNMDCVHNLLMYMERKLEQGEKVKERLTPVLNLLTECSRAHRETRCYLRQQILPPLRDARTRPEEGSTIRNRLVRLMTHLDTELKHCAADLLFVLCKENVRRFVKYTGYGNAAGLLATRGLLGGQRSQARSSGTQYSSDSDSDTEEYQQIKNRVNPVTGQVEEEQPDPMEGMTEEEKEEEAHRLMRLFNRLSKDNVIQPMGLNKEGQLVPLSALRDFSMEEKDSEEENDDLEDVE
ncbi:synembryn-A-like [Myxocyprinus asiaticus]|uniref:synembryn-A-like n=1 Tax=Myxocyprinus asiaticus TaxID=70543 RepID=UPI0022232CCF|nr:synembryn-A-like [Myxocyprinus asiaticus]